MRVSLGLTYALAATSTAAAVASGSLVTSKSTAVTLKATSTTKAITSSAKTTTSTNCNTGTSSTSVTKSTTTLTKTSSPTKNTIVVSLSTAKTTSKSTSSSSSKANTNTRSTSTTKPSSASSTTLKSTAKPSASPSKLISNASSKSSTVSPGCALYTTTVVTTITIISSLPQTLTITSSLTLTPATLTITQPAPSGFIPVQDSLPKAGYVYSQGGYNPVKASPLKRDLALRPRAAQLASRICQTSTVTETSTNTIVTTRYAATTVMTATLTPPLTTTTVYAMCGERNFADAVRLENGTYDRIDFLYLNIPLQYFFIDYTGSAYECCVLAMSDSRLGGAWEWETNSDGACTIYYANANFDVPMPYCPAQTNSRASYTAIVGRASAPTSVVVGNGRCGQINHTTRQT